MDTSSIETIIARCQIDPEADTDLHDLLAVVADRHSRPVDPDSIARGARFVHQYVEQVPYMMKVASTAARNVGIDAEMERVLSVVRSYWEKDDDIIPDHIGMIGLIDDAYCSLTLLQAVSDHFQLQTGKYLFPDNLRDANRVMRRIIGEPYATDLDRLVIRTMHEAQILNSMLALASEEKRLHVVNQSTIWSHGPAGHMPLEGLAELGLLED